MNHFGAKFLKTDFQIHSPRDRGWGGKRPEDALDDINEKNLGEARKTWAQEFIKTCKERELQAIALTDHHEGIYQWYVIDEIKRIAPTDPLSDLWVFPAMELTAKDSAQAIVIFDADLSKVLFEKARNLLNLPANCDDMNKKGIEVQLLSFNIDELQGRLQSDQELQNRFIILPNVTPKGHKTVLREGFHRRFHDMPYVGGYLDKAYPDDLAAGDLRILNGEIPAWTSEKRGVICTSDSRNSDFTELGSHSTWIKLAEPTAESIRQAMLAADSRIRYERPNEPNIYIKSVDVDGAEFLSIDKFELSPQYNTIIGGRGAGKSTLLEYIRFAVGRSAIDLGASDWDPTFFRRKSLIEQSLDEKDGCVRVEVSLDGAIVKFKRERASSHHITVEVDGSIRILPPSEVRDLIHLQTYSQGELSHLGRDKAEQRLLELITDPKRDEFERLENQMNTLANEIVRELGRKVDLWRHEQRLRQIDSEIDLLDARILAIKLSLNEAPQKAQDIIDEQAQFVKTDSFLKSLVRDTPESKNEIDQSLQSIISKFKSIVLENHDLSLDEAKIAQGHVADSLDQLAKIQLQAQTVFNELTTNLETLNAVWIPKKQSHDKEYEEIIQQLAGKDEKAKQVLRLEEEHQKFKEDRGSTSNELTLLKDCHENFHSLGVEYSKLQLESITLTETSLSEINTLSNGLAKATLASTFDLSQIDSAIEELCAGANIRTTRKQNLVEKIKDQEQPLAYWWKIIDEVLILLKSTHNGDGTLDDLPATPILIAEFEESGVRSISERLTQERINSMIKAKAHPRPNIVQIRDGREVDFLKASQGERATTILTILMSQNSGPLLIDQPEEDLDNNVINDIVKATRTAKDTRQLIFATHNANLVVNGDAELVLDLLAGEIASQGAIDTKTVRDSITKTMEGGKIAFELRRKKYNY